MSAVSMQRGWQIRKALRLDSREWPEEGGGAALGCENGEGLGLDLDEGRRGLARDAYVMPDGRWSACVERRRGKGYLVR